MRRFLSHAPPLQPPRRHKRPTRHSQRTIKHIDQSPTIRIQQHWQLVLRHQVREVRCARARQQINVEPGDGAAQLDAQRVGQDRLTDCDKDCAAEELGKGDDGDADGYVGAGEDGLDGVVGLS